MEASVRLCFLMSQVVLDPGGERTRWNIAPGYIASDPKPDADAEDKVMATASASCCPCKCSPPIRGLSAPVPILITPLGSRSNHIVSPWLPSYYGCVTTPANTALFIFATLHRSHSLYWSPVKHMRPLRRLCKIHSHVQTIHISFVTRRVMRSPLALCSVSRARYVGGGRHGLEDADERDVRVPRDGFGVCERRVGAS
ncbi:hypothetical protein FIBSPDRAFT_952437 [Athelia psychrophila]|uniref:Uncharacterized protein n=1 Tax=Athelia psychrophila TaxID=1759441 RepID=A0A166LE96_9AGAM|nr:hypothetical protein FIBSPDRAFT_952437 [Fibularhizoctonia sp. CBS 109695]